MKKYTNRAYCRLCEKWIPKEQLIKVYMPKLGVYAFYCKVHMKQVRLKSRKVSMSKVEEVK